MTVSIAAGGRTEVQTEFSRGSQSDCFCILRQCIGSKASCYKDTGFDLLIISFVSKDNTDKLEMKIECFGSIFLPSGYLSTAELNTIVINHFGQSQMYAVNVIP